MADVPDFLDIFLTVDPGFAGRVAVISAFFDESVTGDKSVFVVAGVYFDRDGLERFNTEWRKRTAGLSRPYRTADCLGGHGPFQGAPWDNNLRLQFSKGLAALIRDTYQMAVAVTVKPDVVSAIWDANPKTREYIPGPYSLGILHSLQLARQWTEKAGYSGEIDYWFESGAPGEVEAASVLARVDTNPGLKARYQFGGHSFVSKDRAMALAAADFIAWQRQRHLTEKGEGWREDFEVLRGAKRGPIYSAHLTHNDVGLYGLLSHVHDLTGRPS